MAESGEPAPYDAHAAAAFMASMRGLKDASRLTYRQLAKRAAERGDTLSHSTLAGALNRVSLPRAELVSIFVKACGCTWEEHRAWMAAYHRISAGSRRELPDVAGGAQAEPERGPGRDQVAPAQLPAGPTGFTGRDGEVDRIFSAEHDRDPATVGIIAIDGMAGVGKTALAVRAAHRLAPSFPDGQLFVDLHGYADGVEALDPGCALEMILRALGIPGPLIPPGLDERAALYRTRLTGTRMLIVLDNAVDESQVVPLVPAARGCLLLITSRQRLIGITDAQHVSIDVLPLDDAVALFAHSVDPVRLAVEPPDRVSEVAELCGRLPLALRVAAARLNSRPSWTLTDLAVRLTAQRYRETELCDGRRSLNAALDLSYRHLCSEQRRIYRLLSVHPGVDADAFAAAALAGTAPSEALRLLDHLVDSHLLTEPVPGRYRFHDLVGAHAAGRGAAEDTDADRSAAFGRLVDHYARKASAALDTVYPYEEEQRTIAPPVSAFHTRDQAESWLDAELENLLATAHAATHRRSDQGPHNFDALHRHLRTWGRDVDAMLLDTGSPGTAEPAGAPDTLNHLGEKHYLLGRHEDALRCFEQALDLAGAFGDRDAELHASFGVGYVLRVLSRHEESADLFARGLDLACATGNRRAELFALAGMGHAHRALSQYEEATRCFQQALDVARAVGDRNGELYVLAGLSHVHRIRDHHNGAVKCVEQTIGVVRVEAGDDLLRCHHCLWPL
jgi:tetratricopeptide (TPR) repeat protein